MYWLMGQKELAIWFIKKSNKFVSFYVKIIFKNIIEKHTKLMCTDYYQPFVVIVTIVVQNQKIVRFKNRVKDWRCLPKIDKPQYC